MFAKLSTKNQVTIPKNIAVVFNLKKGDVLEVQREGNRIVMTPKEVILEDKYPNDDLKAAEKALSHGIPHEEVTFHSGDQMVQFLRKRIKKS